MSARLYVDTAILLRIGDKKVAGEDIDALRSAMRASETRLLVSRAHIQDAVSNSDAGSKDRFVRTVESFHVDLVVEGPDVVEPLSGTRNDIVVSPCSNFRDIVCSSQADRWLASAYTATAQMHEGDRDAQIVRGAVVPRILRKQLAELGLQSAVSLIRGSMGDDPEIVLRFWERELRVSPTDAERATLLLPLLALAIQLLPLRATIEEECIDVTALLRRIGYAASEPALFPGSWLMLQIGGARNSERSRRRLKSDWLDLEHSTHFPYVDFATCDRAMFHAVARFLPAVIGGRRPRVFRNGDLSSLVEALENCATSAGTEPLRQ